MKLQTQVELVKELSVLIDELTCNTRTLEETAAKVKDCDNVTDSGKFYTDSVIPAMNEVRRVADKLETIVGTDYWPFPTYADLLFRI